MINSVELPAREIFDTKPDITELYQDLLVDLDSATLAPDRKLVPLRYSKQNNYKNSMAIDSNMYILHKGNIALLRNTAIDTGNYRKNTIALQYVKTPGFIINPHLLVESDASDGLSDSMYPLSSSEILSISRESALALFNSSDIFRKLTLYSCLLATLSLGEQSQVRRPKHGLITLFANYLLSNQRDNLITISNTDLSTIFGTNEWSIKRLTKELLDNEIIAKTDKRMSLMILNIEELQHMANDY